MPKLSRPKRSLVIHRKAYYIESPCDLDFCPGDSKINRIDPLVMTKFPTKFGKPMPKVSKLLIGNHLVNGPTDKQTDKPKLAKEYTPHRRSGA